MTERIALRDRLQCESFQWYLDNIAVDVPQHSLLATGEIFSPETKLCLDKDDKPESLGQVVGTSACHMTGGNQYWMYRYRMLFTSPSPKSKDQAQLSPNQSNPKWLTPFCQAQGR